MAVTECWAVVSNCQTFGLAHSLQMLLEDVTVEPIDLWHYHSRIEYHNARLDQYDRVLVSPAAEGHHGADFSKARRVDRIPELYFDAYHPDLTYVFNGADAVNGPIGPYHSALAFAAHRSGWSATDAVSLFNHRTYAACGFLDRWSASRDSLVANCSSFGYDVRHAVRRWGRNGPFMYSFNHPRIHVIYDLARIYLEREGYTPRTSDILPHDNLAGSSAFPVYPEIGDSLGVRGSYLFKRNAEYTQIGLRQFVEESFAAYDSCAPNELRPAYGSPATFERIEAMLAKGRVAA